MVDTLTPEQKVALERATQEAQKLVEAKNKELDQSKLDALVAADKKKEEDLQLKLKEAEDKLAKLAEAEAKAKKESDERLVAMQRKIDELTVSKAPIQFQDPFKQNNSTSNGPKDFVKGLTDEQIRDIEERSAEAFFGKENFASIRRQ